MVIDWDCLQVGWNNGMLTVPRAPRRTSSTGGENYLAFQLRTLVPVVTENYFETTCYIGTPLADAGQVAGGIV